MAGLKKGDTRVVVDRFGVDRFEEAQLVDHTCCVRHQFTDPGAALPVLSESEAGCHYRELGLIGGHSGNALVTPDRSRQLGAVARSQLGLVVEHVELRRGARLEQVDHPFGFRRVVEALEHAQGIGIGAGCCLQCVRQQLRQGRHPDAGARQREELSAVDRESAFQAGVVGRLFSVLHFRSGSAFRPC